MLKIQIIIGSTRQNRFSEKAAAYVFQEAEKEKEIEAELIDLREYPLPFFDEPVSPSMFEVAHHEYTNDIAKKWTKKIEEADGYIIISPEYNHGYPAVLKNAIDYVYNEWHKKPVGFVSYGSVGGARVIEQLREVVIELQMVPIRSAIHIPSTVYMAVRNEKSLNLDLFKPLREGPMDRVQAFFNDLIWNAKTLQAARQSK